MPKRPSSEARVRPMSDVEARSVEGTVLDGALALASATTGGRRLRAIRAGNGSRAKTATPEERGRRAHRLTLAHWRNERKALYDKDLRCAK